MFPYPLWRRREVRLMRGGAPAWTPAALFASGEVGVWYDPSDMSTLFQDDAGATPVTAADQTVGRMLDKSGNGNHATQATAAARPILRTGAGLWWLEFDGVDDHIQADSVQTLDGVGRASRVTVIGGIETTDGDTQQLVYTHTAQATFTGYQIRLSAPLNGTNHIHSFSRSNTSNGIQATSATYAPPLLCVVVQEGQTILGNCYHSLRTNGSIIGSNTSGQGSVDGYAVSASLSVGNWVNITNNNPFGGKLFGLVFSYPPLARHPLETIESAEVYFAAKTGVTLP